MREAYSMVWSVLVSLFRSRVSLEAEILILRHQLNIQRRHQPKRLAFSAMDRLIFVGLYRLAPNAIKALTIVKPDTVIRWHRTGFRLYWRWKSRHRCGRPAVPLEIRRLIREMSLANPLWGTPRIHGELLKLGIDIGQTSVAKYIARRRGPPSQGWKTFLRNHADGIVAMDLYVVPTISFRLLYGLLIIGHGRRQIVWFGVTAHPTTEWIANQLTEACGWEQAPRYLIRDRDRAYGEIFVRRVRSIGIRDRPTSPPLTLAKRLRGTVDRFNPEGMHRSCRSPRRTPSAPRSAVVQRLLQRHAHSFVIEQGCPSPSQRRVGWEYRLPPDPRRTSPSIWPDVIYGRHRFECSSSKLPDCGNTRE
jgi:hypothetical protein